MTFLNTSDMSFLLMVSGVFWRNPQTSSWFGVAAGRGMNCGAMSPLCRSYMHSTFSKGVTGFLLHNIVLRQHRHIIVLYNDIIIIK